MSDEAPAQIDLTAMTTELVAAYVARNSVPVAEMPNLIQSVHRCLSGLGAPAMIEASAEPLKPAVPIKKSVTDQFIISLEDGRKFKSLKRHLATEYGMTPAEYRAKWSLPADYPMVAPAYAKARSELAKGMHLGHKRPASEPALKVGEEAPVEAPKKRGRVRKAA